MDPKLVKAMGHWLMEADQGVEPEYYESWARGLLAAMCEGEVFKAMVRRAWEAGTEDASMASALRAALLGDDA